MRKFSSYGPINPKLHYYAPRESLIDQAVRQLVGENPDEGGHYITIWGPRQTGKTWVMIQTYQRLLASLYADQFDVVTLPLEHLKLQADADRVVRAIAQEVIKALRLQNVTVNVVDDLYRLFDKDVLQKPLILILDEFDALAEAAITGIVSVFRNLYIRRRTQLNTPGAEKDFLLHGVALIGVRAVLGVENASGSPFNVQRSLRIPNLTRDEVRGMFQDYQRESGQIVEPAVVERLFYETQGQPGLIGWFGELLTETYNRMPDQPLTLTHFEEVYAAAIDILPNNNILNIISKARQKPYDQFVLELFQTDEPVQFKYDNPAMNFLYLNGVIDIDQVAPTTFEAKFSCPFVQKRLFNFFSTTFFRTIDRLYDPFDDLADTITAETLNIKNLLGRYEAYLQQNRAWLFKNAPRRQTDDRIYEAVYHFNLYMYLTKFLQSYEGQVFPEFPTGNGKVDLILRYAGQVYGLEVKSFYNQAAYHKALRQAAAYGLQLGVEQMWLVFFVETIDAANRAKFEAVYLDEETGVQVTPVFAQTGA